MTTIRATAHFLRLIAILQMLTCGICFLPEDSITWLYSWTGLGHMPHLPFLRYVVRGASYCQGAIGLLLWIMATDVVRYRPLVLATAAIYLGGGPAFYFIDAIAGMPLWWVLMDSISCFLVGGVLLALCLLSRTNQAALPS